VLALAVPALATEQEFQANAKAMLARPFEDVTPPNDAPPMFILCANDDHCSSGGCRSTTGSSASAIG